MLRKGSLRGEPTQPEGQVPASCWSSQEETYSWPVQSASSSTEQVPLEDEGNRGLAGEFTRRGFSSLSWIDQATAPPMVPLCHLGAGTYGVVDLVSYGGEVLVRKRFRYMHDLGEAYALAMLQGAGGTPILKGVIREPLTVLMTHCCGVTLDDFFGSCPRSQQLLQLLLELSVKVGEMHAKGLVHLDLKGDNVIVEEKGGDDVEVHIIDVGLAALPGQRVPFAEVDLDQVDWMCPQVARCGPVTFAADVYALGRFMTRAVEHLAAHPAADVLH